jgi:geranylgeranyl reductase family protein
MSPPKKIAVIGAGPAGLSLAISLAQRGIQTTVFEKKSFPRDKVCGDAIGTFSMEAIRSLDPGLHQYIRTGDRVHLIHTISIYGPTSRRTDMTLKEEAYTCRRYDFDNLLYEYAKKSPLITIHEGAEVTQATYSSNGSTLTLKDNPEATHYDLIVIASGSNRQPFETKADDKAGKLAYGLTRYYRHARMEPHTIAFFFDKVILPGYIWAFALADGGINVGIYLQKTQNAKNINLKKVLDSFAESNPIYKNMILGSEAEDHYRGFPLRIGPEFTGISGDGYLRIGDAAHLVDPFTGEGIGFAIVSGHIAADVIAGGHMADYEPLLRAKLEQKFKTNERLVRLFRYPRMVAVLERIVSIRLFGRSFQELFHLIKLKV